MTDEGDGARVAVARARRAEDARRREREVSEAKERELNEVKGLAQRATVSERLKRHAERRCWNSRELETLRASTAAEREVTEERAREVREDAARQIEEMVTAMKRANESVETLRGRVAVLEKEEEAAKTKRGARDGTGDAREGFG